MRHRWMGPRQALLALCVAAVVAPAGAVAGTVDAPDTCALAAPIPTGASWAMESLLTTGDRDWYTFTLPAQATAVITLGGLTVDSGLLLQASCGTPIGSSSRSLPSSTSISAATDVTIFDIE